MKKNLKYLVYLTFLLAAIILAYFLLAKKPQTQTTSNQNVNTPVLNNVFSQSTNSSSQINQNTNQSSQAPIISEPISDALSRVTKKPFGIYITPSNSPISPEKFTGYHTGVDFETTADEQNIDVPIYAICSGPLILKKNATGYGGVAVQQCEIQNQTVTIIYGHLRLSSINAVTGNTITTGSQIAVLGTGYSPETDGERKHLHLGIHKGTATNLLGYTKNKADLGQWINALDYLRQQT